MWWHALFPKTLSLTKWSHFLCIIVFCFISVLIFSQRFINFYLEMFIKILWWGCVKVWDISKADRQTDKDWQREFGSRVGLRSPWAKSKFTQLAQWSKRSAKSKAYAASLKISSSGLWLLCSSHTRLSPLFPLFSHTIQVYSCSDRSS